jgi:hypothetical protein
VRLPAARAAYPRHVAAAGARATRVVTAAAAAGWAAGAKLSGAATQQPAPLSEC